MYAFKYKRKSLFFKVIKNVKGHHYDVESDRMDVFLSNAIISLPKWSECTLILGSDFIAFEKENIDKESK